LSLGAGKERDLIIYTDGACSGNPGPGGWAAILIRGPERREIGGREEHTTNNRMEMQAAIEGLRLARPGETVHVVTDSRYLHDGISQWIHGWKRRGWRRADGGEVLNRELWEELDRLTRRPGLRVSWEHVRGHAGHLLNERCDELATAFARNAQPELRSTGASDPPVEPRPAETLAVPPPAEATSIPDPRRFPVYVSVIGEEVSVHDTWDQCDARVRGRPGARHKKVRTPAEYRDTLSGWGLGDG
jgi:ribonuclease HI